MPDQDPISPAIQEQIHKVLEFACDGRGAEDLRDMLTDLVRAALADQRVGWRSMDTAPKDGSHMLLRVAGWRAGAVVGRWFEVGDKYRVGLSDGWFEAHAMEVKPTGWAPLPADPLVAAPPVEEKA